MSLDIGGVEGQLREHEASKQAVMELLKFAQNEADSIVSKIKDQVSLNCMIPCPAYQYSNQYNDHFVASA